MRQRLFFLRFVRMINTNNVTCKNFVKTALAGYVMLLLETDG